MQNEDDTIDRASKRYVNHKGPVLCMKLKGMLLYMLYTESEKAETKP